MDMNAQNMPIAPSAEVKHVIAFRRCKNFDLASSVRVISTHNPWRRTALGWNLFEFVLRVKTVTTIGDILNDAHAIGYDPYNTMRHLRWLYTWGDFLEIDGKRYFPEVIEPEPEPEPQPVVTAPPVVPKLPKKKPMVRTKGKSQRSKSKQKVRR
jgi:hypothetical protein